MSSMLRTLTAATVRHNSGGIFASALATQANRSASSSSSSVRTVIPDRALPDVPLYNEPILGYAHGSAERQDIGDALKALAGHVEDIPIVIGSEEIRRGEQRRQVRPHEHASTVATYYYADRPLLERAIKTATEAQRKWDRVSLEERLRIWQRAADLMAGPYRQQLNAATMLGQAKTVIQAEIDSAAELIDFIRMNAHYLAEAARFRPISENAAVTKNSMRYRGIDGFVAAVSPFNFTAIGGNLAYTPALMGNAVLWKPSDTAMLSNWVIFKIMREAGVPDGVVNFVPADGPVFGDTVTASPDLAGINFTGSVPTFQRLWKQVGENIGIYKNFPRLIGECGGKNFHFVHPTADVETVATATIRAGFEFSGQKCSACSRAYVPASVWPELKKRLVELHKGLKVGDVQELDTFTSAVIDERAWQRITGYQKHARDSAGVEILAGGGADAKRGYFVEPTIVQVKDPMDKLMTEEIFGPIVAVYVYPDAEVEKTLRMVGESTAFALTGAVFAKDQAFLEHAFEELRQAAGNFYVNDKSTGSVVGQQPFGGGRHSGTNDKAGGPHYILRWASPQSVKETFVPLRDVDYPYMRKH